MGLGGGVGEDLESGFPINLASTLTTGDAHRGVASSVRGLPVGPGLAPHSRDPGWLIATPRKRCCGATEGLTGRGGGGLRGYSGQPVAGLFQSFKTRCGFSPPSFSFQYNWVLGEFPGPFLTPTRGFNPDPCPESPEALEPGLESQPGSAAIQKKRRRGCAVGWVRCL